MDKTIKQFDSNRTRDAVVVLANWFQFNAGGRVAYPCVESRMLLWCRKGKGSLTVDGTGMDFSFDDWAFLPWKHRVVYEADREHPFLVGGIHIIPRHELKVPVVFQVAHHGKAGLANNPRRRDVSWPRLHGLIRGHFEEVDRLALLATYIVEKYQSATPEETSMRDLAQLLIGEMKLAVQQRRLGMRPLPGVIRRLQEYIQTHLDQNITIEGLARMAGCSSASVHRLFRDHAGTSPGRYVAQVRAERAALLLRTTMLSIAEIGVQVGLTDPFYFSRFFKQKTGLSPKVYQRSRRFF